MEQINITDKFINLTKICEEIWYEKNWRFYSIRYTWDKFSSEYKLIQDEREIIFYKDFMDKLISVVWNKNRENDSIRVYYDLMVNVDNPIKYLCKLLECKSI